MKNSKIEWTDHTFNPWEGCTKVSPGCVNCYAETRNARFGGGTAPNWGKGAPRRRTSPSSWKQPEKWNLMAASCGLEHGAENCPVCSSPSGPHRPRVFCASLADWLDPEVPIAWLIDLLDLIRRTPNLDWLLLTKRPERWEERIKKALGHTPHKDRNFNTEPLAAWLAEWYHAQEVPENFSPPANVWIGTTVENQAMADKRIPQLLAIPAKLRFLSCEPLLGAISIPDAFTRERFNPWGAFEEGIHWVICGGESGSSARPMHSDWACSLRDQCAAAGVPFFFKQWGEFVPGGPDHIAECRISTADPSVVVWPHGRAMKADSHDDEWFRHCRAHCGGACNSDWGVMYMHRVGKRRAGRRLDGREHNDSPQMGPYRHG